MPVSYESGEKFIRVIQLFQRLCDTEVGVTSQQLADDLEVTPRTVQRYIATLRDSAGVDIVEHDGRWKLGDYSKLPAMQLDRYQAIYLLIAVRLLHRMRRGHAPALVGALAQLARALTVPAVTQYVQETIAQAEGRAESPERDGVERAIFDAFALRTTVEITYRDGKGKTSTRQIDPYFLEPRADGRAIYVLAFDHQNSEVRAFKLERITAARSTASPFQVIDGFDLARMTEEAWGIWVGDDATPVDVYLLFDAKVADTVRESNWHSTATFTEDADGRLAMRVRVTSELEMRPWILSWGGSVEVIEPTSLREVVHDEYARALSRFV